MKNPFNILGDGTRLSGLVTDSENQPPRKCSNCIWYKHDLCHHPVVQLDSEVVGENGKPKPVGDEWCCNFFRSPGRILMFAVRHGEDVDDAAIGGWEDAKIDNQGKKDAREAGEFLKGKGIRMIYTSDLSRSKETAQSIAGILGIPVQSVVVDFRLRTWDKGYLNGEEKNEANKKIIRHFKDNPHLVIKDGESRVMFEERTREAFDYYLDEARKEGVKLVVTHNSNIRELQLYVDETLDADEPDSVLPGGIIEVSEKKHEMFCRVVLKDKGHITESSTGNKAQSVDSIKK